MKTDFTIDVRVNLGITPELSALIAKLITRKAIVQPEEEKLSEEPKKGKKEQPKEDPKDDPKEAEEEKQPEEEPKEAPTEKEKELTAEDVRKEMHKIRQKFEGENYKEETTSESYKKYHKPLTAMFKQISAVYGADKPSALPDHNSRSLFIHDCENITLNDNGELIAGNIPF